MRCSACGDKRVDVRPNWKEQPTRESLTGKQWREGNPYDCYKYGLGAQSGWISLCEISADHKTHFIGGMVCRSGLAIKNSAWNFGIIF